MSSVAEAKRLCDPVKKMREAILVQCQSFYKLQVARSNDNTRVYNCIKECLVCVFIYIAL